MANKIFEKRKICMAEMRRNGSTYAEIAKKFNLTTERVRQIIQSYNVTADDPVLPEKFNHKRPPSSEVAKRRKKVIELGRAGKTYREIAHKLGVGTPVVIQDIRLYNKANPNNKVTVKSGVGMLDAKVAERRKKVLELRKGGLTCKEIAKKLNTTLSIVMQDLYVSESQLHEKSLPRLHVPIDDAAKKKIVKMRKAGVPLDEIAEQFDVSYNYIWTLLKNMNVSDPKN